MAHALYGSVSKLICVDSSQGMLDEAERRFPEGPLVLAGYSFGASFEVGLDLILETLGASAQAG